nr:hypothetical protein Iba_chr07fCG3330 [Ipomoea batatas]
MVRGGGDAANLRSSGLWFAVAFGGAGVGRNRRQRKDAWTGLCGWKEPRCVADLLVSHTGLAFCNSSSSIITEISDNHSSWITEVDLICNL